MNNTTPHTDPRILRTRQLIKDAVIELLQEMDIEKISVNRLAERATINRVTFYLHYRDIPDMLEKMADEMVQDIRQVMNRNPLNLNSTDEEYWKMLVKMLEHIQDHAKFYKVILTSKQSTVFRDRLLSVITEMISARLERGESDSNISTENIQKDITIWYGSSALIGTIIAWLRKDMPYTPLFLARQIALLRSQYKNENENA
ncbi:TetR/AcrR family transcriptional regulator C-terminal domain-containing protein [Paenibacillus sp. 19GGS1-52]|uniref:TetR/AcrR family transcriptional regulator n=1 Tax=Paenibacillus sp. 19GGS1-52 TaxID=2758563 RepID=UPI001EFA3250|nr:TetR/AcrR family transcriptional regulator C-terminal domain-containing protein [Paenibacillus sp. 19GGS1-52]ULO06212.1 TetR/AcrR family transcriptional regulator C-terminal domain-containing protein [Paenibacillus sp. 19GGS1-52]